MPEQIVPHCLDEYKFELGRGLRALASDYHTFHSVAFISELLLEKLKRIGGLEEKLFREDLDTVYFYATQTYISGWKSEGTTIIPLEYEKIDPTSDDYSSQVESALKSAKNDFETLASKTSILWNLFFRLGSKDSLEQPYFQALRLLHKAVYARRAGNSDRYGKSLNELDELAKELSSKLPKEK